MVAAVIVLYWPKRTVIHRLLQSLEGQVELIYVIDNTPVSKIEPSNISFQYQTSVPLHYEPLGENTGIAAAQNFGIQKALKDGASHVILFDQDSVPDLCVVQTLLSAEKSLIAKGLSVAAVGPIYVDEVTGEVSSAVRYSHFGLRTKAINLSAQIAVESHFLIASGCLIRSSVILTVGLMRNDLFIDWVDTEWGLRARSMGFASYIVPRARMVHSIGDGVVKFLWRKIHLHTEERNYYLLRNAVYLMRVRSMGLQWKLCFLPRIPFYFVSYPLLAKNKIGCLINLFFAVRDGMCGRLGKMARS